jgi:hypothetical protein
MKAFKLTIASFILIASAYALMDAVFISFTLGVVIAVFGMTLGAWIMIQED